MQPIRFAAHAFRQLSLGFLVVCVATSGIGAEEQGRPSSEASAKRSSQPPFPPVAIELMLAPRLTDPAYFRLVAGDGLLDVLPKVLFARMSQAAEAGETYKALYLARVFTQVAPTLSEGWRNRAELAAALGLTREAAAADAKAATPAAGPPVPFDMLPGQPMRSKPVSIADWAGAMLLLGDAVAEAEPHALPAVRDDVSGVRATTIEESRSSSRGAWARPEPVKLDHVLPNAFLMRSGQPMKYKSENSGSLWAGMGLALLAGAAEVQSPGAGAPLAEASGNLTARADAVKSHYVGGKYEAVTFPGGTARKTMLQPRSSGKDHAVGLPVPVLWAAGGSMTGTSRVTLTGTTSEWIVRVGDADGKLRKKLEKIHVPKMAALGWSTEGAGIGERPQFGQGPVLLKELLFTADDLQAMSLGQARHPLTQLAEIDRQYRLGRLMLLPHNLLLRDNGVLSGYTIGWDDKGDVYYFQARPTQWLFAAEGK